MLITEMNDIILGNVEIPKSDKIEMYTDLEKDIKECISLCNKFFDRKHMNLTKSYIEFYEANPVMNALINDTYGKRAKLIKIEVFYSMLCEAYIPGVPSELTAMLILTKRQSETPNRMIASLDRVRFNKYLSNSFNEDPLYIKKIIDKLWGYNVNLVTEFRRLVTNGDDVEIFIENINGILLCSKNIHKVLSNVEEIRNLKYTKEGIVCSGDVLLRTLLNKFGIVKNDLDLRKVYFVNESL